MLRDLLFKFWELSLKSIVRRAVYHLAWPIRKVLWQLVFQRPPDDVVQGLVSGDSTWRLFTHRGMETLGTCSPHGQLCGTHRLRPRRIPTATRTASSSSRRPHKNLAFCDGSTKEFSVSARSAWSPGLSQKDCSSSLLPDKTDQRYYHRPRRHERQLVDKHNKLFSNNVMIRMLYTNYYWFVYKLRSDNF